MKKLASVAIGVALAAGVAACSSSASSSGKHLSVSGKHVTASSGKHVAASASSSAPVSGTETIYGKITGSAAMADNPVFHLVFSGPVGTTATTALGGQPKKGQSHTFTTAAGNLVVTLEGNGTDAGGLKSPATCLFTYTTTVPFTVNGSASTGRFAGASGTGRAVVVFSGNMPKLGNGTCDDSQNAQPLPKTAVGTFSATTALTLKK